MYRAATIRLLNWLKKKNRKPLVLRGARQVGKTWLVRDMAKSAELELIELNFEYTPGHYKHFESSNPVDVLRSLEAEFGCVIDPHKSLLFLDEIQVEPELLSKLRWFKEEMPELAVVAAGSLLEFVLEDHSFSMPVGRISYFHVEPLSFFEFIKASGNDPLYNMLKEHTALSPLSEPIHKKCLALYRDYCLVGGMPEVVEEWFTNHNINECIKLQRDLVATYNEDFYKYGSRKVPLLQKSMRSAVDQLGNRFVASRVDEQVRSIVAKNAVELLARARLLTRVYHTSGNGIPLGAECNEKFYKLLFLDTGLAASILSMAGMSRDEQDALVFKNKGAIAEQFVGQQIRSTLVQDGNLELYYWQRIGGRQGEVDYIIQKGTSVVPVEVKSGTAGSMKSLHQFMYDKQLELAVRFDMNNISLSDVDVKTTRGQAVCFKLLSLPIYLAEKVNELTLMCV